MAKASKELVISSDWASQGREDWLRFRCPIAVDGSINNQISFAASCPAERISEQVALILLVEWKGKPRAFARIDWNGTEHDNREPACGDWRFKSAGRTHFHDPILHQHLDIQELFGKAWDLPVATPLASDPSSFAELLEVAGGMLHIVNLKEIPEPPWAPRTFFL